MTRAPEMLILCTWATDTQTARALLRRKRIRRRCILAAAIANLVALAAAFALWRVW